MTSPKPTPTFDAHGYPSEETLKAIREWDPSDLKGLMGFIGAAWHYESGVSEELSDHERAIVQAEEGQRYMRFATGGWSGNEDLITALEQNYIANLLTWRLSAAGGLHIYRLPR